MSYKGEDFQTGGTTVSVRVYDDGQVRVSEYGHGKLSEDEAVRLSEFIQDEIHTVKKARGDYGW